MDTQNKSKEISIASVFPILFRYIILVILYGIVFFFFYSNSAQYFLFIGAFLLNLFAMIFLTRDFINIKNVYANIFHPELLPPDQVNRFTTLFIIVIIATLLLQFVSLIMVLLVFNYASNSTNNNNTYVLTTPNSLIMNKYKIIFTITTLLTFMFAAIIALSNVDSISKGFLITIIGCSISLIIIMMSGYALITAYEFMDIKNKKRALYN